MERKSSDRDREEAGPDRRREEREADSSGPTAGSVESLHRTAGNQAVQRFHERGEIQASLAVSQPGDPAEREAQRVAKQVMDAPEPETVSDAQRGVSVDRKASSAGKPVDGRTEERIGSVTSGGKPLAPSARSYFEPRFGRDLGDVRVHTGRKADRAARSIDAEAFTHGSDIVFRKGNYSPGTRGGKRLLAHELTHVVQQGAAGDRIQRQNGNKDNRGGGGSSNYTTIKQKLSRGATDWAITDGEAKSVLEKLAAMSDQKLVDTYYKMIDDGIWTPFVNNVPSESQERFKELKSRIESLKSSSDLSDEAKNKIEEILKWFFPNQTVHCVNNEVAKIAAEMVAQMKRCSDAMDWVPRPPGAVGVGWLVLQAAGPFYRRIVKREGGTKAYDACKQEVKRQYRSSYRATMISTCERFN